jgi:ABC-2 type transport system permease protein
MSTVAATDPRAVPAPARRGSVTQLNVLRSEWTKLWSLRSTRWSLLAAVVAMLAMGPAVAAFQMHSWATLEAQDRATFDSINVGVSGYQLAELAIGVLGILVIAGEYSTGMIRSTFLAVPRRLPVLWAKLGVFCAVTFVLMLVAAFASFLVVQAIVQQHGQQQTLGDPHALRAVVGAALFLTVLGAMAVGIGALVRNTAGGIALFVFLLFVLPGITGILPHATADAINPYLPLNAGSAVATSTFEQGHTHLSPWGGFAVFSGYTLIVAAAAAVGLVRRDA